MCTLQWSDVESVGVKFRPFLMSAVDVGVTCQLLASHAKPVGNQDSILIGQENSRVGEDNIMLFLGIVSISTSR